MKSTRLKIITLIVVFLMILFSGVLYFVSTKVSPEKIREVAIQQMSQVFPKAEIQLSQIDYSIGFSVKLKIEKLSAKTRIDKEEVKLFSVNDLEVKVPIWAILTNGGDISVKVVSPEVTYFETVATNNWTYALGEKKKEASVSVEKKETPSSKTVKKGTENKRAALAIPAILTKSRFNIKLLDVAVDYRLKDKTSGKIDLKKFAVKSLNFETPTAFELVSKMNFNLSKEQSFAFEALCIGQFNLAEFITSQTLTSIIVLNLNDIKLTPSDFEIPNLKTDLKVVLDPKGNLVGDFSTSFLTRNVIAAEYSVSDRGIYLDKFNTQLFLKDLAEIVSFRDAMINLDRSKFVLNGGVKVDSQKGISPDLTFALNPGVELKVESEKFLSTAKGAYKGDKFSLAANTRAFEGNIDAEFETKFNVNKPVTDLAKISPLIAKVNISNLNIKREVLQKILYKESPQVTEGKGNVDTRTKGAVGAENKTATKAAPLVIPPGKLNLVWNHVKIGGVEFVGKGDFYANSESLGTKNLMFQYGEGKGSLSLLGTVKKNGLYNNIKFDLKKFNLIGISPFLPPQINQASGIVTAGISGSADYLMNSKDPIRHDIRVNLESHNGEVKGFNIGEYISGIIAKLPKAASEKLQGKKIDIDGNYEMLTLDGRFQHDHYWLKKLYFKGIQNKAVVNGNGNIYPTTKKQGEVLLDTQVNLDFVSSFMKKEFNTNIIPMKFSGPGMELQQDYAFTVKQLGKNYMKSKGQKQIKKLLKNQKLDKVLDNKKVDKLLKGFFK